jgi:hypothetical protein
MKMEKGKINWYNISKIEPIGLLGFRWSKSGQGVRFDQKLSTGTVL